MAVAIGVIVFLLPVCINCAIYVILCYSTMERSKEKIQESVVKDNLQLGKVKLGNSPAAVSIFSIALV